MPEFSFALLYIDDPPRSAAFYADLLGRPPLDAAPGFAMLPLKEDVMLGLWSKHAVEPRPAAQPGAGEIAFTVQEKQEVDAVHADWQRRGLRIVLTPVDKVFGRTFVALDPDGHRIRASVRAGHDPELARRCLGGPRPPWPRRRFHAARPREARAAQARAAGRPHHLLLADHGLWREGQAAILYRRRRDQGRRALRSDDGARLPAPFAVIVNWSKAKETPIAGLLDRLNLTKCKPNWGYQLRFCARRPDDERTATWA